MRFKQNQLKIIRSKFISLTHKIYPAFKNFPRYEQLGMTQHLRRLLFETISHLGVAIFVSSKRLVHMQQVQANLYTLKGLLKISRDQKYITPGFYEELDEDLRHIHKSLAKAFK